MTEKKYSIGLDIGTGSVGWAVIDDNYRLLKAKGKNLIGVRLFDSAQTAEERRGFRATRRRLSRRRWRIRLLNGVFAEELNKKDEKFLHRLKYSWVSPDDNQNPQINENVANAAVFGSSEEDKEFYKKYPTIYHLRKALMDDDFKHDIREVYLAVHHLVKYRGHFLIEGDVNPSTTFNVNKFIESIISFDELINGNETAIQEDDIDETVIETALTNKKISKSARVEQALSGIKFSGGNKKEFIQKIKAILIAVVGNKINLQNIFGVENEQAKQLKELKYFSDVEIDSELANVSDAGILNEEQFEFLNSLKESFDGITLKMLLGENKTLSDALVQKYNEHKQDLKLLKSIFNFKNKKQKEEFNNNYLQLIKGDDPDKQKKSYEFFEKQIESSNLDESQKQLFHDKMDDFDFLPKQRTKANGSIPNQLHLNELRKIIEKQSKYLPISF